MDCKSRRQRSTVCCCFPWPHVSPRSEKRCLPPKMALIQIKLNEVRVANPCVFQLLKHPPPSRMSGSSPLHLAPYPLALLSSCLAPSPWRRQQQAPLWLSAPLRLHLCLSVWTRHCVFHCKFAIVPFWLIQGWIPFACFVFATACVPFVREDLLLFVTGLHISHIHLLRLFFVNLHLNVKM